MAEGSFEEAHTIFMTEALLEAQEALQRGEVPIGCVIFDNDGQVIARGSNRTNERKNATCHAEFIAFETLNKIQRGRESEGWPCFKTCTLCVTCEPCIMCAAAIVKIGMGKVVYGCPNERFGGCGSVRSLDMHGDAGKSVEVVGGVRKDECIALLKTFYEMQNPNAPVPKRKKRKLTKNGMGEESKSKEQSAGSRTSSERSP